ncbi:DNA adenine methylase [Pseudoduganella sp. SL102]|uniref:DNA adenine methylase n=1 Tax=Pseudoduganella sp. SL102 TaxID=2995154 RepID=UPI00248AA536|nr:DNA adenine methylase [Pseudoduganella sp. SL102]WBS04215.1 DNA adenine methylase [Pseudoduganella sp. SL102]
MDVAVKNEVAVSNDIGAVGERPRVSDYAPRAYPQVIKYMGSKASILRFIGEGFAKIHEPDKPLVDLFAGACAISGGFGHLAPIISNDIQSYSATIASTYLHKAQNIGAFDIVSLAYKVVQEKLSALPAGLLYPENLNLEDFNELEGRNRALLQLDFSFAYHLFTKNYSGTWWSAEQCVWIDSIREVLDQLHDNRSIGIADFQLGLTCLMHAMAYTSQGTGHYAQYRDAKTVSSMKDINKYRRQSVASYFARKFDSLLRWNLANATDRRHQLVSQDYHDCLADLQPSVIYADPPYAFVHYSRFYHAIETLVKYDYPTLQVKSGEIVKGRYRVDRHQSPFCIRTQVREAFADLFDGVKESESDLLLSYSNTGMINIEELIDLASSSFGKRYEVWFENIDHDHMTMGRLKDRSRQVKESLIMAKRR